MTDLKAWWEATPPLRYAKKYHIIRFADGESQESRSNLSLVNSTTVFAASKLNARSPGGICTEQFLLAGYVLSSL